jgi:hypothetical protein
LVAGAVGAGTVFLLGEPARAPSTSSPAGDGIAALQDRLDRQEREIAGLRARLDETAGARGFPRPPAVDTGAGHVVNQDETELQIFDPATLTVVDSGGAPPATDLAAMSPEERAKYETVYKAMREKEQEEGRKARLASFEAGLRARLDRIPETVGLTAEQKDAAVRILLGRGEKLRAAFEEARTAGGADGYRAGQEKAEAIRKEARDALAQALTVEQAKAVEDAADRGGQGNRNRGDGGGRRSPRNNGTGGTGNPPR